MERDEAWFERLYERHHRAIAAYCLRRIGSDDAAEATNEVFTVAWRRRADVPGDDRAVCWLYGVARRVLSHHRRSADRSRRLATKASAVRPLAPPGPDAEAVDRADRQLVRDAVQRLGDIDREALLLAAWEGLSHAEIATVLGCSQAAADKRVARAKVRLAREYAAIDTRSPEHVRSVRRGGARR